MQLAVFPLVARLRDAPDDRCNYKVNTTPKSGVGNVFMGSDGCLTLCLSVERVSLRGDRLVHSLLRISGGG